MPQSQVSLPLMIPLPQHWPLPSHPLMPSSELLLGPSPSVVPLEPAMVVLESAASSELDPLDVVAGGSVPVALSTAVVSATPLSEPGPVEASPLGRSSEGQPRSASVTSEREHRKGESENILVHGRVASGASEPTLPRGRRGGVWRPHPATARGRAPELSANGRRLAIDMVRRVCACMISKRSLFLVVWLPLAACSDDDPVPQGTEGETEGSTGTSGSSTGSPVAESGSSESGSEPGSSESSGTASVDTTAGETTAGETTAGETTAGETTMAEPECGNRVVEPGEACDDGEESETCDADCSEVECGDGTVNGAAMEACDDAGESAMCDADCSEVECGDGTVNMAAGEACDDADAEDFDFCSNACVAAAAVVLDGLHVFDTDAGTLDGVPQAHWDPASSTWYLSGLALDGTLTVIGTDPLTIEVDGDVVIAGLLDVSGGDGGAPSGASCNAAGVGGLGGPGGFDGGSGAGFGGTGTENGAPGQGPGALPAGGGVGSTVIDGLFAAAGGGGGGHLAPGAAGVGNTGALGGAGGELHASLPPLVGGGGGGGGSIEKDGTPGAGLVIGDDEGTGGGGGGGAIAVHSTTAIVVTGTIDASGGNGGDDTGCPENPGFGGGGAGGAIVLDAPATDVMAGTLDVSGGRGGLPTFNQESAIYVGGDGSDGNTSVQ
jgi:hypothetical protein